MTHRILLIVLAVLMSTTLASPAFAQGPELLMFEEIGCEWCDRWHEEVGEAYPKTTEGRRAPLRSVILGQNPGDISLARPVTYTPTFVLIEDNREVGRITGYPGADFFWGYLAQLVAKLAPEQHSFQHPVARSLAGG